MDLIDRDLLYQALHNAGGCDAEKGSYDDGWDSAITEAIRLLYKIPRAKIKQRYGMKKVQDK